MKLTEYKYKCPVHGTLEQELVFLARLSDNYYKWYCSICLTDLLDKYLPKVEIAEEDTEAVEKK